MAKIITSVQNPIVKHLIHLRQNRDYREEHQSLLIEGYKLISEVCPKIHTKHLIVTDEHAIPSHICADEVIIITEGVLKKLSSMVSPEGYLAEVSMPSKTTLRGARWVLALDGVSDPGNLGTLIRTTLALGWEGVFVLENSCDPYNEKALRAAKGATFRIPITSGNWTDLKKVIKKNDLKPLVADMKGKEIAAYSSLGRALLVLNNESQGISDDALQTCQKVSIPMPGEMESLNVAAAGAILMYTLRNSK